MENFRTIRILIIVWGGTLLVLPFFVFAYDQHTTHPALTQEIIKFYNKSFPQKISNADAELIIQGSIDEDKDMRFMNHFFDPVYDRGLTLGTMQWPTSKIWAQSPTKQAGYIDSALAGITKPLFSGTDDYTWDRAVYEYTWHDKRRGLESLGHVLHLLEDLTVPEHTRDDPHPHIGTLGSPYENWAEKFNRLTINIDLGGRRPILLNAINNYFEKLANYSNQNFFSVHTIFSNKYKQPNIIRYEKIKMANGLVWNFAIGKVGSEEYKLVKLGNNIEWQNLNESKDYFITDDDNLILSDYWSHLSKQAVVYGAGAVKLFFDEVEKEKQSKVLYEKNRSVLAKSIDSFRHTGFAITSLLYGSSVKESDLADDIPPSPPPPKEIAIKKPKSTDQVALQKLISTAETHATQIIQTVTQATTKTEDTWTPILGAADPTPADKPNNKFTSSTSNSGTQQSLTTSDTAQSSSQSLTADSTPNTSVSNDNSKASSSSHANTVTETKPFAPVINSPLDAAQFSTTAITFSGTATSSSTITNSFNQATASVTSSGNWSLTLDSLPVGTSTIQFFAKSQTGMVSDPTAKTIYIVHAAPAVFLDITECSHSFAHDACVLATTTLNLAWSTATSSAVDHYEIRCSINSSPCPNFLLSATTTATSTEFSAPYDNVTYTFSVQAVDAQGTIGALQTKTATIVTRPVVINEIGWAGTSATRDRDEWIELMNTTNSTIDLSGWILTSLTDQKPTIHLSGTIPAKGFYLIERTDDTTIADIPANLVASFGNGSGAGLSNSGEVLALQYNGAILDRTPEISACGGWCGGVAGGQYFSMERYDPYNAGDDKDNWSSWVGPLQNGKNADGLAINGTPGRRNSINYYIVKNITSLNENKTITKSGGPYLISNSFTIQSGAVLTIEPGVVIKLLRSAITVQGTLKALGTKDNPIVFTSFNDDNYGGDTNQDATTTVPKPGDWLSITFLTDGSEMDHTIIRYGGDDSGNHYAAVRAENASFTVSNSTIEFSKNYGIWLKNSSSTIAANMIQYNDRHDIGVNPGTGIIVSSGAPAITKNTIHDNGRGMTIDQASTAEVHDNTITKNTNEALYVISAYPEISRNSVDHNGINGVVLQGTIDHDYTFTPGLPYVIQNTVPISGGHALTISPGAIIKFDQGGAFAIQGKFIAEGTDIAKIIFTSLKDDDCGIGGCGDTDNVVAEPRPGDWMNIFFAAGTDATHLNNMIIRYGGTTNLADPNQGALISETNLHLQNSIVEKNYFNGILLRNATSSIINNSVVQNHRDPPTENVFGLRLENASVTIQNTKFSNNKSAIGAAGSSTVTNGGGIIFENNITNTEPANLIP